MRFTLHVTRLFTVYRSTHRFRTVTVTGRWVYTRRCPTAVDPHVARPRIYRFVTLVTLFTTFPYRHVVTFCSIPFTFVSRIDSHAVYVGYLWPFDLPLIYRLVTGYVLAVTDVRVGLLPDLILVVAGHVYSPSLYFTFPHLHLHTTVTVVYPAVGLDGALVTVVQLGYSYPHVVVPLVTPVTAPLPTLRCCV